MVDHVVDSSDVVEGRVVLVEYTDVVVIPDAVNDIPVVFVSEVQLIGVVDNLVDVVNGVDEVANKVVVDRIVVDTSETFVIAEIIAVVIIDLVTCNGIKY